MRLDDPRLAAEITTLVDRRIQAALAAQPQTRYGVVAAVNTAAGSCSVYLGASTVASPGFMYPALFPPAVGSMVRVVIAGADRYVDANLTGGLPMYRGRGLVKTTTQSISNGSWTEPATWNSGQEWGTNDPWTNVNGLGIRVLVAGLWLCYSAAVWTQGINHRLQGFSVNTVTTPPSTAQIRTIASNIQSDIYQYSRPMLLAANDTVHLMLWQNRGSALDLSGAQLGVVFLGHNEPGDTLFRERQESAHQEEPTTDE